MHAGLPLLVKIAKEAGDAVFAMQKDVIAGEKWTYKPDGSPISIADIRSHEIINGLLADHFPGIAILSEEATAERNARALQADERFDVDPLDNTTAYIKGHDGFSVNIGRVKDGVPVAGVVYFPAKKMLYFTGNDGKAYLQQGTNAPKEIHAKKLPLRNPLQVAVGYRQQNVEHLALHGYEMKKYPSQLRTCKVAEGECDITGIDKSYGSGFDSWDTAGSHAVLLAAGGDIVSTEGVPVRYNKHTSKIPDHIAGATDVLVTLGLGNSASMGAAKVRC